MSGDVNLKALRDVHVFVLENDYADLLSHEFVLLISGRVKSALNVAIIVLFDNPPFVLTLGKQNSSFSCLSRAGEPSERGIVPILRRMRPFAPFTRPHGESDD
ncbi:hypothetical protein, partial [Rhizobium sp.]|uniref:hypothetical protein n=1 Tax=Rhizobium sp. TaxID=391 RepID=UPI0028AB7952